MEYILCEDWFIYARTHSGEVYWVSTEMWHEKEKLQDCDAPLKGKIDPCLLSLVQLNGQSPKWQHCEISGSCTDCPDRDRGCDLPSRASMMGRLN